MNCPEEKARQEGIRLLEVHVKLLREARAELRCQRMSGMEGASSSQKGGEDRLINEIAKVEEKIETWKKAYEEEFLHGNNIWDIIKKEEAEHNREVGQRMMEVPEVEEEEEKKEKERMMECSVKEVKENEKCNAGNIVFRDKGDGDEEEEDKEKQMMEENTRTFLNKGIEMNKCTKERNGKKTEKEIFIQESDTRFIDEKKEANETPRSAEVDGMRQKRPLEETPEEEEDSVKRRKVTSPDGGVPKPLEGHKVLVQNLPLNLQYNDLRNYFMQFGTVTKVFMKPGAACGFVVYEREAIADLVCSLQHRVGDQEVRVIRDMPRPAPHPGPQARAQDPTVFVAPVPPGMDTQALRYALSSFGPVVSVAQPCRKAYAFVAFESESSKEAALQAGIVTVNSRSMMIRPTRTSSEEEKSRKGEEAKGESAPGQDPSQRGYQVFLFGVNIPLDLNAFKQGLAHLGMVVSAHMPEDKNYAFVGFKTQEGQQAALKAGVVNLPSGRAVIRPLLRK